MPLSPSTARLAFAALTVAIMALMVPPPLAHAQSGTLPAPSGTTAGSDILGGTAGGTGGATPPPIKNNGGGMPPPLPKLNYFVALGGQPAGPFNAAKLAELAGNGSLTGQTLVWTDGMADWKPASGVADMQAILKTAVKPDPDPVLPPDNKAKGKAYLTGTWTVQNGMMITGNQQAQFNGSITYKSDGTSSAQVQMNTMGGGGQPPASFSITSTGTWEAELQGKDQIKISSNDNVTIKSVTNGQTQTMQNSESDVFTVVNATTMRDKFGNTYTKTR